MTEATKPDKTRQLSQEQMNAIEHLLQGQSDRSVAEAAGAKYFRDYTPFKYK